MEIKYSLNEIKAMLNKCREMGHEPWLEISFISRYDYYVLKYGEKIAFQRSGKEDDRSRVFYYDTFEEMAHDGSLDELLLDEEWNDIDYLYCAEFDKCDLWNDICRDMYFEGEDFGDMMIKNRRFKRIDTLAQLFQLVVKCSRADTAAADFRDKWLESDATYGHSDIYAMLVQDMFGGDIYKMYVNDEVHYFNEADGNIIDLARDHYEENLIPVIYDLSEKTDRGSLKANGRYEMLIERMEKHLEMMGI